MVDKAGSFQLTAQDITLDPHIARAFMAVNQRDLSLTRSSLCASVDEALEQGLSPSDEVKNVLRVALRVFGATETNRLADEIRDKVFSQEPGLAVLMDVTPV